MSTIEIEYKSLANAAWEVAWLKSLLKKLGYSKDEPIIVYCENQSSNFLLKNLVLHVRIKHIELHHHYFREKTKTRRINLVYISTNEQQVDMFTKPLRRMQFQILKKQINLGSLGEHYILRINL
jgi:hypothetical protein